MRSPGSFRHDINGLRAWAVVAVVLYHFGISGFTGGFVGVDVFFVISGYLMTGIILGALAAPAGFSFWNFYLARARRILPALLALCAVLLALGWFFLLPSDYQRLGKHVWGSVLFTSNRMFMKEAGYFDVASHDKWLLHTWSLSVEWQFYLLFPLLLVAAWRWLGGHRWLLALLGSVALASLGYCVLLADKNPSQAFYFFPSRAWELLAGGVIFLIQARWQLSARQSVWIERAGMGLIIGSLLLITPEMSWPGLLSLIPVSGAALVLLARRDDARLTANGIAQWLGIRSYSIYLWHWPVVVALAYLELSRQPMAIAAGLALTLILGHLSYHWVEQPSGRRLGNLRPMAATAAVVGAMLVVMGPAKVVRKADFVNRLPEAVQRVDDERDNRNPRLDECDAKTECQYGGPNTRAIVLGDSHAQAIVNAIVASLPSPNDGVLFIGTSGCPIIFGAQLDTPKQEICQKILGRLQQRQAGLLPGTPVIVINRASYYLFGGLVGEADETPNKPKLYFDEPEDTASKALLAEYREHYVATACALAANHPLYLVRPTPEMGVRVPEAMGRAMLLKRERKLSVSQQTYRQRNAFVSQVQDLAGKQCGAHLLDPIPYLCDGQQCSASRDGRPLYYDDDHLSEFGNRLLVPMFQPIFAERLAGEGHAASPRKAEQSPL
ncbi:MULTISPECIES: acyltransferase family protein [Pseudomonas]|uniref:acyltransferase family protein n=1 Tax=Pseudomonas nitroreducens TaxID=46680 RepID=UPI001E339D17|nr:MULTISPECIES: acyltransferase family protein [Pseudomonas]MCE4071373.1 acyltransferase [Pseudomonas nitritireducens]MCE4080744.1 acyltransferase [Pseudomonas nitroreducens]